ncbi:cytoplasmic protein [Peribacillus deserti]|uniref:Cytoplasmic protein n=2 Tax=Peribacillus deserti TaxID=673318 RepID=A0A2N5M2J8_9BACI|nr:cytoplasmic protein [Peribacillus deserti]
MMYRYSHKPVPEQADYVIVLGARVKEDGPSLTLQARINAAAGYLSENQKTKAIVSGGKGLDEPVSEAQAMKEGLESAGIDETRIILEPRAKTTYENIKYSKKLIRSKRDTVLLVTNDFHIYRSVQMAKKQGMTVKGLPAPTPLIAVPKSFIREYLAITKYLITGKM